METLAYLYHAEAYDAKVKDPLKAIATKTTKKSRKKSKSTKPANAPELNDVAFSWMP